VEPINCLFCYLLTFFKEEELKNTVIAIFANKQDLPEAASAAEVSLALGLDTIKDRTWTIIPTSATKGDGIIEGFEWFLRVFDYLYTLSYIYI
jgi:ADP-ribosylation factor-like protein 1